MRLLDLILLIRSAFFHPHRIKYRNQNKTENSLVSCYNPRVRLRAIRHCIDYAVNHAPFPSFDCLTRVNHSNKRQPCYAVSGNLKYKFLSREKLLRQHLLIFALPFNYINLTDFSYEPAYP